MQKILIIGNSHSVDAFALLNEVFRSQQPEKDYILGIIYYSGCSITQHINFYRNNEAKVHYYKHDGNDWTITKEFYTKDILADEKWDTVFLQAAKADLDDTLNQSGRRELEAIVCEELGYRPQFMWHTSWPSPNDEIFFAPDAPKKVPEGYKDRLIALYGFNPVNQFTLLTDKAKAHILQDEVYAKAICTGAAIMNAHITQGRSQREIWRDYTHLNDFGRLIVAHAMYVQLTGEPLTEIKIDLVPAHKRWKLYVELGDLVVTDEMKEIILKAANHSLADPWPVPEK